MVDVDETYSNPVPKLLSSVKKKRIRKRRLKPVGDVYCLFCVEGCVVGVPSARSHVLEKESDSPSLQ